MNNLLHTKKGLFSILLLLLLALGIPVGVYLSQNTQLLTQNAASEPDLIVNSFQLTDSGGNVRSAFSIGEDIYVRVSLKNQGGAKGISNDGLTMTTIYANKSEPAGFNSASTPTLQMKNGEFGAGTSYIYSSIYSSTTQSKFVNGDYSWRRSNAGKFTARILINANKFVAESNFDNNQIAIEYTISSTPLYLPGKTYTTPPSGYDGAYCTPPTSVLVAGLVGCVMTKPVSGKNFGKITNTGSTTRTVGMSAAKAYITYPIPYPSNCNATDPACTPLYNWIWTQTIYSAQTTTLSAGKTVYIEIPVPDCSWQVDAFEGNIYPSFTPPNRFYSGSNRYLDGYFHIIPVCKPVIPSPTPTSTPVPSATPTLTPTPNPTDTPTPTATPVPSPSVTPSITPTDSPTPTPTICPIPATVNNVKITCPNCQP